MKNRCGALFLAGVCALFGTTKARAATVTYNIVFTSTDPLPMDPLHSPTFTGAITLEAADIAAKSSTPRVDTFSARQHSFSGAAQNAMYDAVGDLYSIGLSDTSPTFIMHGNAAPPTPPEWEILNAQVPLQKEDFGTYALTLAPEPGAVSWLLFVPALRWVRRRR